MSTFLMPPCNDKCTGAHPSLASVMLTKNHWFYVNVVCLMDWTGLFSASWFTWQAGHNAELAWGTWSWVSAWKVWCDLIVICAKPWSCVIYLFILLTFSKGTWMMQLDCWKDLPIMQVPSSNTITQRFYPKGRNLINLLLLKGACI